MSSMTNGCENPENRKGLFGRWAVDYDRSVRDSAQADSFPFAGYDRVLDGICREIEPEPGMAVLDLGTGTGNLARRVQNLGCRVWGTDLSVAMLEKARARVPEAFLVEADLRSTWPKSVGGPFDRIVSAYVLHEFDLPTKVSILLQASKRLSPQGKIVLGDIAFSTRAEFEKARQRWHDLWDHAEHYWVADEALDTASRAGLRGRWAAISICAGILVFEPVPT